jgi:hypothetical protein
MMMPVVHWLSGFPFQPCLPFRLLSLLSGRIGLPTQFTFVVSFLSPPVQSACAAVLVSTPFLF